MAFEGSQIILNCPHGVGRGEQLYWISPYGERIGPETISVQYGMLFAFKFLWITLLITI